MCGIVGYVGKQPASPILVDGLRKLSYRGYDSAGHVFCEEGRLSLFRKVGHPDKVARAVERAQVTAKVGISHTRWATHGEVSEANTHPHLSNCGKFALVHNGVIENYNTLKNQLIQKGIQFSSQTDTEVLCNLISYQYSLLEAYDSERLVRAVQQALQLVKGSYGIGLVCSDYPGEIIGARNGSPLVVGVGKDEYLIASDVSAFAGRTQNVVYLEDGQIVRLTHDDFSIRTLADDQISPVIDEISWSCEDSELGDFPHYMLKEIFEQPVALENSMRGRFSDDRSTSKFGGLNIDSRELRQVDRILFLACGTAWHACLVAEHLIERYARIPVEVEYASEMRYRNAPLDKNTLVCVVSQSGETKDTLEALREAKRKGYRALAITNTVGSSIAREADGGVYQHVGPEIGVASTKAFTSQITIAAMLALHLGRLRDLSYREGVEIVEALQKMPTQINQVLSQAQRIEAIAQKYCHYEDFLFLGRQMMFPMALEGALKLKEISYIHAEGYPAAEMKHGPIALISPQCPSVVIAPSGEMFDKVVSNIQEIRARKGPIIAITCDGCEFPEDLADDVIYIPDSHEITRPILAAIPLQLFAYYMALMRGCNVDRPRNLAKSVTVE